MVSSTVKLRDVYSTAGSAKWLYELLRERSVEKDVYLNISHRALPTWREHLKFFRSHTFRAWYLIDAGNEFVGYVSLTKLNEIGVIIMRAHREHGYATEAVRLLLAKHKPLPAVPSVRVLGFVANVHPKNARSIKLFCSLGFRHVQNSYVRAAQ